MLKELESYKIGELKIILGGYGMYISDIVGHGKHGCILKSDIISYIIKNLNPKISIFDFDTYKHEYDYMKTYYSNLELMLKTALFIDYKYNHLPPENNTIFEQQIEKKSKKDRKKYIEKVLNVFEPLYLVTEWFQHFAPEKLVNNPSFAINAVNKYENHISLMFNRMYKARFDKNWPDDTKLWFD
jgi:hypothetical protein